MTRVFENRGHWWRQTLSMVAVIVVALYGVWELWSAAYGSADYVSPLGQMFGIADDRFLFGVVFAGGGAYALWQLINDSTDIVTTFDVDDANGASLVTLWRPFWTERLTGDVSRLANWRSYVKVGKRNTRTFYIYADHPDYPRPLRFDLARNDLTGLRRIAPDAVAEFERATAPPASKSP